MAAAVSAAHGIVAGAAVLQRSRRDDVTLADRGTNLFPLVFRAFAEGKPVLMTGDDLHPDGTGVRDYIHVADPPTRTSPPWRACRRPGGRDLQRGHRQGYSVLEVVALEDTGLRCRTQGPRRPGDRPRWSRRWTRSGQTCTGPRSETSGTWSPRPGPLDGALENDDIDSSRATSPGCATGARPWAAVQRLAQRSPSDAFEKVGAGPAVVAIGGDAQALADAGSASSHCPGGPFARGGLLLQDRSPLAVAVDGLWRRCAGSGRAKNPLPCTEGRRGAVALHAAILLGDGVPVAIEVPRPAHARPAGHPALRRPADLTPRSPRPLWTDHESQTVADATRHSTRPRGSSADR
jgi:hypothetical protein